MTNVSYYKKWPPLGMGQRQRSYFDDMIICLELTTFMYNFEHHSSRAAAEGGVCVVTDDVRHTVKNMFFPLLCKNYWHYCLVLLHEHDLLSVLQKNAYLIRTFFLLQLTPSVHFPRIPFGTYMCEHLVLILHFTFQWNIQQSTHIGEISNKVHTLVKHPTIHAHRYTTAWMANTWDWASGMPLHEWQTQGTEPVVHHCMNGKQRGPSQWYATAWMANTGDWASGTPLHEWQTLNCMG